MLGLSWSEIALILVVALLVIKPEDLPNIIKSVVSAFRKLKSHTAEIRKSFTDVINDIDLKDEEKNLRKQIVDLEGNLQDTYALDDIMPLIKETKVNPPEAPKKNAKKAKKENS